jgi:hypothetical protein
MENKQKKENGFLKPMNADKNSPTTNPNIESHKKVEEEGYAIAPEDTMIDYDNDESQLDMDTGNPNIKAKGNQGIDDND